MPAAVCTGKTTSKTEAETWFTLVGAIGPAGPAMLTSAVVNVLAVIERSNVRVTRSVGVATSPMGLAERMRGPAVFVVLIAENASSMPPVVVLPARPGSGRTVESVRSTSHCADALGKRPASSDTTPVTWAVAMDVPFHIA